MPVHSAAAIVLFERIAPPPMIQYSILQDKDWTHNFQ